MHGPMFCRPLRPFFFFLSKYSLVLLYPFEWWVWKRTAEVILDWSSLSLSAMAWHAISSNPFVLITWIFFFFTLFLLLLITFTIIGLSQYPVIDRNYPTSPTLERWKGMGRGRTFGAKFLFAHQWHLGGSSTVSGSFICSPAGLLEIKDRRDSGRRLQCLFCRLGWFCLYVNHVIHMI